MVGVVDHSKNKLDELEQKLANELDAYDSRLETLERNVRERLEKLESELDAGYSTIKDSKELIALLKTAVDDIIAKVPGIGIRIEKLEEKVQVVDVFALNRDFRETKEKLDKLEKMLNELVSDIPPLKGFRDLWQGREYKGWDDWVSSK